MGQAKQKRARLGEWYNKPIVPGHPDYVAPVPDAWDSARYPIWKPAPRGVRTLFSLMALAGGVAGLTGDWRIHRPKVKL